MTLPRIEALESGDTYGKYEVQPLEPGYGITLGNALRRVMLSSLPGAAVTSIKIDGVYHEFSEPQAMLKHLRTALRPDGRMVLLEYRKKTLPFPFDRNTR